MKNFKYHSMPIFFNGFLFLIFYPLFFGGITRLLGFSFGTTVFYSLLLIYGLDLVIIFWLFLNSWGKGIGIYDNSLQIGPALFRQEYEGEEIRDILLYATAQGKEYLRIRTRHKAYYVDDQYRPWDTLLLEMENFASSNNIRTNLTD